MVLSPDREDLTCSLPRDSLVYDAMSVAREDFIDTCKCIKRLEILRARYWRPVNSERPHNLDKSRQLASRGHVTFRLIT